MITTPAAKLLRGVVERELDVLRAGLSRLLDKGTDQAT